MSDCPAASDDGGDDLIVIPARYGSSRLPGKPLLTIAGRSLLERVLAIATEAADAAKRCAVVVATDDARIADHAAALGAQVVLTAEALDSGTMRAHAAALLASRRPAHVINLQGDAPFIPAQVVAQLLRAIRTHSTDAATPVFQLDWDRLDRLREHKKSAPFSGTTCVRTESGQALWFSKSILPALRDEAGLRREPMSPIWQHLGLYAYRFDALEWFARCPPGRYERLEGLEQLRFLEHGRIMMTVPVDVPLHLLSGIDTAHDLAMAEAAIARYGDPFPA